MIWQVNTVFVKVLLKKVESFIIKEYILIFEYIKNKKNE